MTLLARASAGEPEAFAVVVERHAPALERYVGSLLAGRPQDAEEALQEGLLAAWRHLAAGGRVAHPRAWLYRVVRHAAWRRVRRRAGEPDHFEPLERLGERAGWGGGHDPEALSSLLESGAALKEALAGLSEADREAVWLRDVEGLSGPEAAEAVGLPLAAFKSRLHRARLRLRARLQGMLQGGAS